MIETTAAPATGTADDFLAFRETFMEGRAAIQRIAEGVPFEDRRDGDAVHRVAVEQWERLSATQYAGAMRRDQSLADMQETLEGGMAAWIEAWAASDADKLAAADVERMRRWSEEECFADQRSHEFWGRLGCILYHFRDRGRCLPTHFERNQRTVIGLRAAELHAAVQGLVSDPLVATLYRQSTLASLDRLSRACEKVSEDLVDSPLEVAAGADPFHDSDGLIRSQFSTAFGLLALELYGHVTPTALDTALEIKSGTAELLGLVPWGFRIAAAKAADDDQAPEAPALSVPLPDESRLAILRKMVGKVLVRGLALGERRGWVTLPLARFYADSASKRRDIGSDERERSPRARRERQAGRLDLLLVGDRSETSES